MPEFIGMNFETQPMIPESAQPAPGASRRIRRGVIGILHDQGRYLLIQRAPQVALGGTWCFPGGHIEPGENSRSAVIRELLEELGIDVRPCRRLGAVRGRPDVLLAIWMVEHIGRSFHLDYREIADMNWLTAAQIRSHPQGLPSNLPVVERLERWRLGAAHGQD